MRSTHPSGRGRGTSPVDQAISALARPGWPMGGFREISRGLYGFRAPDWGWRCSHTGDAVHLAVLAAYIVAGIVVSWPRVTYLVAHKLPYSRDAGSYVWGFAWVARQVEHLSNPWFTRDIAAPVGVQLGYHALMPLEGVLMTPVTVVLGPSVSYNLLSVLMPGLLCYAMYRVGRLWLPSQLGAIAAGAFFGLSSMLVWRSWYHLNLAAGVLFIP